MAKVMQTQREQWVGFCQAIGGEEAVVARLADVICQQRTRLEDEPTCEECKHRARQVFDAAAVVEWWPLGYGVFKMLSNLMGCTEWDHKWAPSDEEEPCPHCDDTGWVEDQNWQPEHPRQRREERNGLIPCGALPHHIGASSDPSDSNPQGQ